jgi:hypothetical protein
MVSVPLIIFIAFPALPRRSLSEGGSVEVGLGKTRFQFLNDEQGIENKLPSRKRWD